MLIPVADADAIDASRSELIVRNTFMLANDLTNFTTTLMRLIFYSSRLLGCYVPTFHV